MWPWATMGARLARAPKKRPAKTSLPDNTAALRLHTRALNRHSKAVEDLLESPVGRTEGVLALAGHRHFTKPQIKQVICDITGNPALDDKTVFSKIFAGDGGVADSIIDQINHAFGPPPLTLTYDHVAGLKIGDLVDLIYGSL